MLQELTRNNAKNIPVSINFGRCIAMLSKAKIKFVQTLKDKKQREAEGLFVVEGNKIVPELLSSKITVKTLFATADWLEHNGHLVDKSTEVIQVEKDEIKKVAFTQTPQDVVALAQLPDSSKELRLTKDSDLVLVLDTIQDPGNLGTILRIADWYGIQQVVCSPGCADVYSPKVIQATMGSFIRVQTITLSLEGLFASHPDVPVYGALMNGQSVYATTIKNGFLLIGNEGQGIHESLMPFITHPVTIPRRGGAESLNAGVAAAILCDAWARG
jgi:TrmH family RNA methyltransferase